MKLHKALFTGTALAIFLACSIANAQGPGPEKKYRDYTEVVRGGREKHDGFFTLQQKDDHLYAEIMPFQFDQPMLAPITIARGMAMAGQPLNFGDEWVLVVPRGRRQGPADPPEHPLQGPGGFADGEGGQAELHRLDPDGLPIVTHQPR